MSRPPDVRELRDLATRVLSRMSPEHDAAFPIHEKVREALVGLTPGLVKDARAMLRDTIKSPHVGAHSRREARSGLRELDRLERKLRRQALAVGDVPSSPYDNPQLCQTHSLLYARANIMISRTAALFDRTARENAGEHLPHRGAGERAA